MKPTRLTILAVFLAIGFAGLISAQGLYRLPQVANGQNLIQTTFVFVNNGSQDAVVTLTLTGGDGQPMDFAIPGLNPGAAKVFTLEAGQTRIFTSDGQGDLLVGSATVASTAAIGVTAVFSLLGDSGTVLLTEAGVGASGATSELVIAVDTVAPFNTGVAISNLGVQPADLTYQLYDQSGTLQETLQIDSAIPRQGQLAVFVAGPGGLFPTLGDFRGRLVVRSTTQVAAVTLRQNVTSGAPLTTLPIVPRSSAKSRFNLPQVANGFAGSLGIKTQFIIFSIGPAAQIRLELTNDGGDPYQVTLSNGQTASSFDLDLPANGALFVETDGQGDIVSGAARIEASAPVGVTAVFSLLDAQGNVTVEAGVGDSEPGSRFSLPVDLTSGFDTGVALFNPNPSEATVAVSLFDQNGAPAGGGDADRGGPQLATQPVTIAPLGHLALYVSQLFEGASNLQGQLGVTSDQPLSALSLRQQTASGTLTTFPVIEGVYDPEPPVASATNLLRKTVPGISITENTTLDVQLSAGFKLSGFIRFPSGFFPLSVRATSGTRELWPGSVTNPLFGNYSVIVPQGTYQLTTCLISTSALFGEGGTRPAQEDDPLSITFLSYGEPVTVTGDTQRTLDVPDATLTAVSGTLQNLDELPEGALEDGTFVALSSEQGGTQGFAEVGPTGEFAMQLGSGSYDASLAFGKGQDLDGDGIADNFDEIALFYGVGSASVTGSGSDAASVSVPDLVRLSGTMAQPQTQDYSDSQVLALDFSLPQDTVLKLCIPIIPFQGSFSQAQPDGTYAMSLKKGELYDLLSAVPATEIGSDDEGVLSAPRLGTNRQAFASEQNQLDFEVPAFPATAVLSGRVTGPTGSAVSGAVVSATTQGGVVGASNADYSASTVTDAQGSYSLTVLSGTNYEIQVSPPMAGSSLPF